MQAALKKERPAEGWPEDEGQEEPEPEGDEE